MAELTNEAKSPDCICGTQSSTHFCKPEQTEDSANTAPYAHNATLKKFGRRHSLHIRRRGSAVALQSLRIAFFVCI